MGDEFKKLEGAAFVDDRGPLRFVNDFDFEGVKRFYQVENHEQGFIRAWHGHVKEGKYVYVPRGTAWLGTIKMNKDKSMDIDNISNVVLSDKKPQVYYIPPGYYNGFKTLEKDTIVMFFSTVTMEEAKGDDFRLDYADHPMFKSDYR